MNNHSKKLPVVMTIAGSDSGGGAGIQADLKAFTALGTFGTSAITCLTAQNPSEVRGILAVTPAMVTLQVETICAFFRVAAAKTGMLYSAAIIEAVAMTIKRRRIPWLVVDPVMIATSGARLLRRDAVSALCNLLLPLADVITPNLPEAEALYGQTIGTRRDMESAAREIGARYRVACVVKGGHLPGQTVTDVLYHSGHIYFFRSARLRVSTHGTGCMFSAALTALLARGYSLPEAVRDAKRYVHGVLKRPL
ncbi:MAG: bifunctional hydroxymethylpyrimidine kinase/phosphomethylpyrimidine kinase [Verrucomicrobia bacterium]|nr:bifunctional hydroxymethylpyrimidine kinase/phosphomethylpyrimidine kinase [Verrucomicrobiota bacterium]MBU1735908.1 bifunctional hydroxymethylpyrimidine kinase/phosphomethylpyrimidine kinase [Verrucomicrobiota bacterium]MBU1857144.1 bifunctional hydroxymethylpyrimidine kinase/phosphomethylpyrimidine kinase [Verrucomicrobiota bacterium]